MRILLYRYGRSAFTLIELLVVIGIISLLLMIIIPSLNRAKAAARTAVCTAQMKQWALATLAYTNNNDNTIPSYGDTVDSVGNPTVLETYWFNRLSHYLTTEYYGTWGMDRNVRKCPEAKANWGEKAVWIGVYYGHHNPDNAPFIYPNRLLGTNTVKMCNPFKLSKVRIPASYMMMLDVERDRVQDIFRWKWDVDHDGDGAEDSNSGILAVNLAPYNWAQPKIHRGGCNVALFDGHVEWIDYKEFWELGDNGYPIHQFWFNNNRP